MKRYKVRQIIRFLERDGWRLRNCKGDHRQYVHPEKSGKGQRSKGVCRLFSNFKLKTMKKILEVLQYGDGELRFNTDPCLLRIWRSALTVKSYLKDSVKNRKNWVKTS